VTDQHTRGSDAPVDRVVVRPLTPQDDPDALRRLRLEMLEDAPVAFIERLSDAVRHPPAYWRDRVARYTNDPRRAMFVAESRSDRATESRSDRATESRSDRATESLSDRATESLSDRATESRSDTGESGGDLVGQGGGYIDTDGVAHLVTVYVTPRARGRGLVEQLAEQVFAWAIERGCHEIRLEVAEVNARAVAAYRRLGFRPTGRSQPHPLYPEEGVEIEMAREL